MFRQTLPFFIATLIMFFEKLTKLYCKLCPRECNIDRNRYAGLCKTKNTLEIASYNLHFGEEPPISGKNGSGTIFFAGCNLSCIYCQNFPISQLKSAFKVISEEELADIMIQLQSKGAHNINLVTPSHFIHLICKSIDLAKEKGLTIPIAYNTSSYDKPEVIEYLSNYIDIYMADLKYTDNNISKKLSGIDDYFDIATKAILAMHKTKGSLKTQNGIATKGLIIRHLVLPNLIDNTKQALKWIVDNLPDTPISLMFQYFPAYKAFNDSTINRKVNYEEYLEIIDFMNGLNLKGFIQEFNHEYCN